LAFTFVRVRLVVLAAVELPARQREAKESLSERFETHQGTNRRAREDLEDQSRIIFLPRSPRTRAHALPRADSISKAAKPHTFSGNDRATLSTRARFKAILLVRARKLPCDGRWRDRRARNRARLDGDERRRARASHYVSTEMR
jgi:hypothetical protein